MTNTRYLPRDHAKLDLYAETYPELAEYFAVLANEVRSPAKGQAMYYALLREALTMPAW
jgi:hypothetical protein